MEALIKKGYDKNLIKLGFYPVQLTKDAKTLKIADLKNDRELHFELDEYSFESIPAKDFDEMPKNIKSVLKKDNGTWFDDYEVIVPVKDEVKNPDPFLIGIKDGKRYFISSWDTHVWEM